MEEIYIKPPRTLMEVYQNLPEGTMAQLINNQIYMSPAPTDNHQRIVVSIVVQLGGWVEAKGLGSVRVAPYDVYIDNKNAFQPDIVFISNENTHKIKENGLHGAPDLVIEILSPGTRHLDKGSKKNQYERSGVKEYWIINPKNQSTEGFFLVNNAFQPLPAETGKITSKLLELTVIF